MLALRKISKRKKRVVPLLALLLLACGATTVTIRVDVRSFISQDNLSIDYYTPAGIPEVEITDTETITLPEEVNALTDLIALEVNAVIDFHNYTGSTEVIYNIYFNEQDSDPFDSGALVVSDTVNLEPDSSYLRDEIVIEGDQRLLSLFSGEEITMGSEVMINPGGGPEDVAGKADITELVVTIQAAGE